LYGVLFIHGWVSSKFHDSSWELLVSDYGLRHRHIMTVRLEHYETLIGVDFYRGGDRLSPLPYVCKFYFKEVFSLFCVTRFVAPLNL
jgi:hypothetical protein